MQEHNEFKNKSVFPFLKRLLGYAFQKERKSMFLMLYAIGMVAIVESYFPSLFKGFIDECASQISFKENPIGYFQYECIQNHIAKLIILITLMTSHVMLFIYLAGKVGEKTIFNLRKDLFYKMQHMSFDFLDRNSAGWLLTRISSDTDRVMEVISWGLIGAGWGVVMIFFCFGYMFYFNWILALLVFLTIPILLIGTAFLRIKIMNFSRKSRKINSEMIGLVNEHIYGIEVNKLLGNEYKSSEIYNQKALQYKKASYKSSFFSIAYFPITVGLGSIATFMVLNVGGNMAIDSEMGMTIGMLASFFVYSTLIFEPILDITNYYSLAQNAMSAGERIFSLIDQPISVKDYKNNLSDFTSIKGQVEIKNVQFGYNKNQIIIPNLNLTIKEGTSVALVGPTGEGKTTISSLIARFYEPTSGEILIDGIDYRQRTLESYRKNVGFVMQTPNIFSGTLFENIQFGNPEISKEKVQQILLKMGLKEMAENLNMRIESDGSNMSMGQKQLIAMARVFAYNPKILILDEATSNLDIETEIKIQKAIQELIKNRTSIIIAHRLSTIVHCDRILVIDKGNILEDGNHQELLEKNGAYSVLYHM
jgi:ATP-binding cassette subfamily B protein